MNNCFNNIKYEETPLTTIVRSVEVVKCLCLQCKAHSEYQAAIELENGHAAAEHQARLDREMLEEEGTVELVSSGSSDESLPIGPEENSSDDSDYEPSQPLLLRSPRVVLTRLRQ